MSQSPQGDTPEVLFRCVDCGGDVIVISDGKRADTFYKGLRNVPIPNGISVHTCLGCGSMYFDRKTAEAMDFGREPIWREAINRRACESIITITQIIPQAELCAGLGLSHGYLSKVLNGKKDPSAHLTALLMMIAAHPARRWPELKRLMTMREDEH